MENDRYLRHSMIDWFDEQRVRSSRWAVVGAEAVGNEVVKNLTLLGVGKIDIFDLDRIELHNLTRSVLFRESDVGNPKAETAAARARELDGSVEIEAVTGDFWHTLGLATLRSYQGVFCCVDNFEARNRLNGMCRLMGVDWFNIGLDSRFASVDFYPWRRSGSLACFECGLPDSVYQRIAERYSCGWLRRHAVAERKIPTTILTASMGAAAAVSMALHHLHSEQVATSSRRLLIDTVSGLSSALELVPQPDCPGCAGRPWNVEVRCIPGGIRPGALGDDQVLGAVRLQFSDRVLESWRCGVCDPPGGEERWVFERAERFSERDLVCPRCHQPAIQPTIRNDFRWSDLLERYSGRPFPAKFAEVVSDRGMFAVEFLGGKGP